MTRKEKSVLNKARWKYERWVPVTSGRPTRKERSAANKARHAEQRPLDMEERQFDGLGESRTDARHRARRMRAILSGRSGGDHQQDELAYLAKLARWRLLHGQQLELNRLAKKEAKERRRERNKAENAAIQKAKLDKLADRK